MGKHKKIFASAILVILGLFWLLSYLYQQNKSDKIQHIVFQDSGALIRDYSPSIGSPLLRVTLVEFLDPECESCSLFHPVVKKTLKQNEGRLRYVVRYAPFHPNSKFVVSVLEAARLQNKYWEALDLFFEKLPEWGDHNNPRPDLIWTYVKELGLDVEKIKQDSSNKKIADIIEQEIKDGIKLGIRQTPTFFINGMPVEMNSPDDLVGQIETALSAR